MLSVQIKKRDNVIVNKSEQELEKYIEEQFYPEEETVIRCKKCKKEIKDIKEKDIKYKHKKAYVVCDNCYKHRMLSEEELIDIEQAELEELIGSEDTSNDFCDGCLEDLSDIAEEDDYGWGYKICPKCGTYNYSDNRMNGHYGY